MNFYESKNTKSKVEKGQVSPLDLQMTRSLWKVRKIGTKKNNKNTRTEERKITPQKGI